MKYSTANCAAFPRPCGMANGGEQSLEQDGMTMREWYAGQALTGLLAAWAPPVSPDSARCMAKIAAQYAFVLADAMLAEAHVAHDVQMASAKRRALEHPDETE